jgi:hypothetical protein
MNVADLLPAGVPGSVRNAVDLFHQSHLITAPPVFYGAAPATALCPFTEENADLGAEWQVLVLPEDMRPAYAVVTSQTCDICQQGEWDNPFVQVSPVIDLSARLNSDQKTQLRRHGYTDFVYLTRQPQPDGFWVADLRISLPLEKGALVGKEPIEGFDDEISRLTFGERVANRSRRPAFADTVHDVILHELNGWIRSDKAAAARANSGRFTDVEEVRFGVDGDRLKPDGIKPVVFMESDLPPADRQEWRNWQKRVAKKLRKVDGPRLTPVQFSSLDKMLARQYCQLVPVRLPELGREPRV